MADPIKGTGKKPKGSDRRLYTDENPRDTVKIKFATPTDARNTVTKVNKIKKPFARKTQTKHTQHTTQTHPVSYTHLTLPTNREV